MSNRFILACRFIVVYTCFTFEHGRHFPDRDGAEAGKLANAHFEEIKNTPPPPPQPLYSSLAKVVIVLNMSALPLNIGDIFQMETGLRLEN